jgi:hypothetical protein
MSYIIATERIPLAVQDNRRAFAIQAGKNAMFNKKIVNDPGNAVARDPDYTVDFTPAGPIVGLSGWLSMPLAAVGTNYSVFANSTPIAVVPQVPNNQVWVFYGAHILTLGDPISKMYFFTGQAANRKAQFDLEKLYSALTTEGLFDQPVVYYPQDFVTITVQARVATGAGCRIVLDTLIFDPLQNSVV